ncbi:MAG TPA: metallophosphoesterase [Allosphingosinicella sp.]|jgi:serine/threonine protein phosphatase 1
MGLVDRLRSLVTHKPPAAAGAAGARAYAVGDVHGRLDLLDRLLARIEADNRSRPRRRTFVVFLGDLIDRGPASAGVVELLRSWQPDGIEPVYLAGNHEEVMLNVLAGQEGILPSWLKFGGAECLASYGLDVEALKRLDEPAAIARIRAAVPREHRDFVEGFGDTFRFGDYLFVHAGIRPGVAVEEQHVKDLRWIREPFLGDGKEHGFVVVHGHTICDRIEERPNRIGIDTGAYTTGNLTALGVEDEERWYLSTLDGAPVAAEAAH